MINKIRIRISNHPFSIHKEFVKGTGTAFKNGKAKKQSEIKSKITDIKFHLHILFGAKPHC